MKLFVIILSVCIFRASAANAQTPRLPTGSVAGVPNAGKLISQLVSAIKPSSFIDAFKGEKSNLLDKAAKAIDPKDIAGSVSSLAGFIKPNLFKQGFSAQSILQTAGKVKTMADASGLLKTFEGALKPEAFTGGWASQKTGWLSALSLLK